MSGHGGGVMGKDKGLGNAKGGKKLAYGKNLSRLAAKTPGFTAGSGVFAVEHPAL